MTTKTIRTVYRVLTSVSTVVAGICLAGACLGIYRSGGDQIFTPEKVAAAFSDISLSVYICLALVVGGFILDLILPEEKEKRSIAKQYPLILQRLHEKADLSQCEPKLHAAIRAEQNKRKLHLWISLGLLLEGSIVFLCYALNGSHFHQSQINESMIRAMYWLLPCMAVPFGYGVFAALYSSKSIQKEIELVKLAPKAVGKPETGAAQKKSIVPYLRWGLLAIGIIIFTYGYYAGGTADVLTKAINICTECVGLG